AYIFGTMERIGLNCHAYDRQLSGAMIKYWTNFAKNGDPNGGGLPSWPIYSCEEPLTMVFSDEGFEAVDLIQTEIEDRIVMYSQEHPGFITEIDDVLRNGE
ncbi:MAG: carboxylesterase family protein, partial [Lachnospiraceae bacterium]|nr:carboxylesterase family protein [Lachnospiraceae bacterium]